MLETLGQGQSDPRLSSYMLLNRISRNPADLAVLKSIGQDATEIEQNIVEVFSQDDDILADFDFTPIHRAVLQLYDAADTERPSLKE